uniref:BPTI/Kunitz inhibitor domain-containing protein n=1 Tax=Plectus sambesii TaxID=2011161 RepID=A0A914XIM1_9BILA
MKSTIYVYVVLVCSVLAADAAVFSSKCARVRCTACQKCEMSTGICVPDPSQQNCGQSASSDDAITACSTVRCSECQTCKQNDAGQAKCVYVSGCCPANQPHVSCFVSSCQSQAPQCPSYANCVAADCGSCQAKFYDKDWNEICVGNSSSSTNNSSAVLTNSCAATLCPVNTTCVEDTNCSQPPCSARCEPFKSCGDITCQADEHCVFNPDIRCIRAPCPQYTCEKIDTSKPCSNETCPSGTRCVPATLFCKKAPCPQYTCEPVSPCDDVQCPPAQICQPDIKQCFTTPCPQYKCVADPCATARCAGRCVAENGQAKCVNDNLNDPCHDVQCPPVQVCQPAIKQCFTTPCPQYQCVADPCATVRCAGKCVAENGQAKCVNDNLNDPCHDVQCPAAQICQPDIKQCFTTPCPQYRCVADPCATARCAGKCVAENGQAKCIDGADQPTNLVRCSQLPDQGNKCKAAMQRWHFSRQSNSCEQFTYGGCDGNENNFLSESDCKTTCQNLPQCPIADILIKEGCRIDGDVLNNNTLCPMPNIVCDSAINDCALVDCMTGHICQMKNGQAACIAIVDDKTKQCSQLPDAGMCEAAMPRFYYSRTSNQCLNFTYGGCGGNSNKFDTMEQCMERCKDTPPCPMYSMMAPPAGCEYVGTELNDGLCPKPKVVCNDSSDCATANCPAGQVCVPSPKACFTKPCPQYDCVENPCNLVDCKTDHICQLQNGQATCVPNLDDKTKQCSQLPDAGMCMAYMPRFYYSRTSNQCLNFTYGGCSGNSNNFETIEQCQEHCKDTPPCPMYRMMAPPAGCEYAGTEMDDALCPKPKLVCNDTSDCATAKCPAGQVCVPSPKACFTKPCPQYDCVENPCNLVDCQSDWRCIV